MLPGCYRVCLRTDCVFLRRHRARHLDRGAQCFPGAAGCVCAPTASSCADIAPATWTEERNASRVCRVCLRTDCVFLRRHRARHLDRGAQCFPGAAGCGVLQGVPAHRLTHWAARCADQKSTLAGHGSHCNDEVVSLTMRAGQQYGVSCTQHK